MGAWERTPRQEWRTHAIPHRGLKGLTLVGTFLWLMNMLPPAASQWSLTVGGTKRGVRVAERDDGSHGWERGHKPLHGRITHPNKIEIVLL